MNDLDRKFKGLAVSEAGLSKQKGALSVQINTIGHKDPEVLIQKILSGNGIDDPMNRKLSVDKRQMGHQEALLF